MADGNNEVTISFKGVDSGLDKSLSGAQTGLKGVAESAKQTSAALGGIGNTPALKTLNTDAISLAKSLGLSYGAAKEFAAGMKLTTTEANQLVQRLKQFQGAGASASETFKQINAELGTSEPQFKAANKALKDYQDGLDRVKTPPSLGEGVARLAFGFNNVLLSLQAVGAAGQGVYESLIASNERLNQQILSSQTNLASSTRIFQGGAEITDPTAKIQASQGALRNALKGVEKDTESLVGVTSQQVNELFQITLANAAALNKQSKEFPGPIDAARSLTKGWAAAMQTLQIPLDQSRQEINSILRGTIDQNSIVAKNLDISKEQVRDWKSQGILVDELNKRLETFVAGNALAARSIAGIGSNIQDLGERLARTAGEPLLEPTIQALDDIYKFLKQNEGAINAFFTDLTSGSVVSGGQIASNLGPALQSIIEVVQQAAPIVAGLIAITEEGLVNIAAVAGPVIDVLGRITAKALEGYAAIVELVNIREINDASDALNILAASTDRIAQSSINTGSALKALNDIQAKGGKLTAEQTAEKKRLNQAAQNEVAQIGEQIKALKELSISDADNSGQRQAQIKSLEATRDALSKNTEGITFAGKEAIKLGTTYEQVAKKAKAAFDDIKNQGGGDPEQLKGAFKDAIALTQQQVELGQLSAAEGEKRLGDIANNTRAEAGLQEEAQKTITTIRKEELDRQTSDLAAQTAKVEALQASGKLAPIEAAQQITALKKQQLDLQVADVERAIAAEQKAIAAGSGSKNNLGKLKTDQTKLIADREKAEVEGEARIQDARLKVADDASQKVTAAAKLAEANKATEVDALELKGVITKEEGEARKLAATRGRIDAELAAELLKSNTLKGEGAQSSPELERKRQQAIADSDTKIAQLRGQQVQNQAAQQRASIARIQAETEKADAAIKASATAREIDIQKLVNAGTISESEANEQRTKSTQGRIDAELKLERDKLAKLKALPNANSSDSQKGILAQQQKVADLTLQQLQNQARAEEALRQKVIQRLQQQQALQKVATGEAILGIEKQVNEIDRLKTAQDLVVKSIERQGKLLQSNRSLAKAQADAAIAQGDGEVSAIAKAIELRRQLSTEQDPAKRQGIEQALAALGVDSAQSELDLVTQKQAVEDRIAAQKQAFLAADQVRAKASLDLDLQREASAARQQVFAAKRAELEAQIAKSKAAQTLSDAKSQLAVAQQEKDPAQKKVAVAQANEAVANAQQQGVLAEQQATDSAQLRKDAEQSVVDQQKIADNSRQLLEIQQQSEIATAAQTENLRQANKILESSAAYADRISQSLQGAPGSPKDIPARKEGGPVGIGETFLGAEVGPELVQYSGGGFGLLESPGLYQVPRNGTVLTAAQTQQMLAQPAAGLNPGGQGGNAGLLREIKGLRKDVQGYSRPSTENTYNINDAQDPVAKVIELQRQMMGARYGA